MDQPAHQPRRNHPPGDRRALVEAFQQVVKSEAERMQEAHAPKPRPSRSRRGLWIAAAAVIVICTGLLLIQPSWLTTPAVPPETREMREASLRMAMFNTAQRIEAYRRTNQRLPATAQEAGAEMAGITYAIAAPDGYVLTGRNGGIQLEYHSNQPIAEFLGNSYRLIRERFKK